MIPRRGYSLAETFMASGITLVVLAALCLATGTFLRGQRLVASRRTALALASDEMASWGAGPPPRPFGARNTVVRAAGGSYSVRTEAREEPGGVIVLEVSVSSPPGGLVDLERKFYQ
jgi:hypothetical protein